MTTKKRILCLCLCLCRASATKVKLSDVKAITLTTGQFTTGRRSAPVLQQQCRGNFCNHSPGTIQCTNMGSDGLDIQWACEGDLPKWLTFKGTDVNCEGYDYPTDPYILAGSCGISYSLEADPPFSRPQRPGRGEKIPGLGGLLIAGLILLCCCNNQRAASTGAPVPPAVPTAMAAAAGAAAGYAAGRSTGWGWGRTWGGYHRRSTRRSGNSGNSSKSWGRSGTSRRTARTHSSTSRR